MLAEKGPKSRREVPESSADGTRSGGAMERMEVLRLEPATSVHAMLADQFLPHSQFDHAKHRIVDAEPTAVFTAARELVAHGALTHLAEWAPLGEQPGKEIVVGAVRKLGLAPGSWHGLEPRDFPDFAEAGYGKFLISLSIRPYGRRRSLITHEIRVVLDDPPSWSRFHHVWPLLVPLLGRLQVRSLNAIEKAAVQHF